MNVIEVRGGGVSIAGRPLIRQIDFAVAPGEVVALVGENGSGKSTLVKMLMGLRPISAGTVSLFGTALDRFSQWHRVGYVPQHSAAASGVPATVWEVAVTGRLSRRRILQPLGKSGRAAITDALSTVGLLGRAHHPFPTLSGGQQQRVLIARALAAQPDLLVLDEPTAGVDLANQELLAETLHRLVLRGATIVVVLHELGPLEPLITRMVTMHDGLITYDGPPQPALASGDGHHHPRGSVATLRAPIEQAL